MNNLFNVRRVTLSASPSLTIYSLFILSNPFQNYLLGRKETSEMIDRNKEALLEVSLGKKTIFF